MHKTPNSSRHEFQRYLYNKKKLINTIKYNKNIN